MKKIRMIAVLPKKCANFADVTHLHAAMSRNPIAYISRFLLAAMMLFMVAALSSCGSSKTATATAVTSAGHRGVSKTTSASVKDTGRGSNAGAGKGKGSQVPDKSLARIDFKNLKLSPVSEKLLREADSWIGTSYLYGGNDRDGVDCSGFVVQVFKNSLGISLPRTSVQQQTYCDSIGREELMPGDLVFFTVRGGSRVGHVGIYIGDNKMVHSSSSKGVIISSLEANYYVVNYLSSGRVSRYYAMCGDDRRSSAGRSSASPASPAVVVKPEAPVYAAVEVAKQPVDEPSVSEPAASSAALKDDALTADEQAAVRARAAMRVARIGRMQQDSK